SVNSIFLGGTDYAIGGNAITLTSLSDTSLLGANALNLPITLTGTLTASVNVTSTQLTLGGVISGSGGLVKNGAGILRLSGASADTYTGPATVSAGTLELSKTGGALAVPSALTINGGTARELGNNQIADTLTVGEFGAFDLNNFSDVISSLTVDGSVT